MKCKCHGDKCSGTVTQPFSRPNKSYGLYLCCYHGELVRKLKTQRLADLDRMLKLCGGEPKKYVDQACVVALCSSDQEWKTRSFKVYGGTYDYTKD